MVTSCNHLLNLPHSIHKPWHSWFTSNTNLIRPDSLPAVHTFLNLNHATNLKDKSRQNVNLKHASPYPQSSQCQMAPLGIQQTFLYQTLITHTLSASPPVGCRDTFLFHPHIITWNLPTWQHVPVAPPLRWVPHRPSRCRYKLAMFQYVTFSSGATWRVVVLLIAINHRLWFASSSHLVTEGRILLWLGLRFRLRSTQQSITILKPSE